MNKVLQDYATSISASARRVMAELDTDSIENLTISAGTQEKYLDEIGDLLVERRDQLIKDLNRVVVEYSAKIEVTNELIYNLAKQAERRLVFKEQFEGRTE